MVNHREWFGLAVYSARIWVLPVFVCCGLWTACSPAAETGQENATPTANTVHVVPAYDWGIGPSNDFDDLHPVYTIVNDRSRPLAWQARSTAEWLTSFDSDSGELAPGESIDVMFEIDIESVLEGGTANVEFIDRATGSGFGERTVTIEATVDDSPGWTSFEASGDTQTVYVSRSSGDDANDGLSPGSPKRTIAAGVSVLRHGRPDWLLLRRGDTWHEGLGQWKKSGRSRDEPMLVSTYGDDPARPLLRTGAVSGVWTNGGGNTPDRLEHVAFVGLHFVASEYDGAGVCVGAQWLQPSTNILFEDCVFQAYSTNLVFQAMDGGRHKDFAVRRSVVVDAYSIHDSGAHPQGLYAYNVDGLLIEENVFDHNGWNEDVPNAGADIYSHNLYIDNDNKDVVVRGNIIARASSHGMQLRPGGTVINNLFLLNSIALSVGGGNNPEPGGATTDVRGNVILQGKDIDSANPRGWGMWFGNIKSGRVAYNVIANNWMGHYPIPLYVDGEHVGDTAPSIGVQQLVIERNIIANWGGPIVFNGNGHQIRDITLIDNQLQDAVAADPLLWHSFANSTSSLDSSNNRFHCPLVPMAAWTHIGDYTHPMQYWMSQVGDTTSTLQAVQYHDPDRSPATYNAYTGEIPSEQAFFDRLRAQSRTDWRPDYLAGRVNRYLRSGFHSP